MRIHDIGPRADDGYPAVKRTYAGWDAHSRWGSRPHRAFGRPFWRAVVLVAVGLLVAFGLVSLTS
jgi:hypothetical protein